MYAHRRAFVSPFLPAWLLMPLLLAPLAAPAQDAVRGAGLYLGAPQGLPSCVSCHGSDPSQNRNRLLLAADNPQALLRAINAVGAMGYLGGVLTETDRADLSAYLGRISPLTNDNSPLALAPLTIEFGVVPVGGASARQRLSLFNRQPGPVTLGTPQSLGVDVRIRHDCPTELAPGARCDLTLDITSAAPGTRTGALSWPVSGEPALLVPLSVDGRSGPVGKLTADTLDDVDFGVVSPGGRSERVLRLTSSGDAAVTLGAATLTGPDRARFQVEGSCSNGLVLPPGSGCELRLGFAPIAAGDARASLQWRSDGMNPGNLVLTGRAVAAQAPPAPPAAPPVTPPPVSPQPPTAPVAPPLPEPAGSGGGGGCSMAWAPGPGLPAQRPVDPVLLLLAAWAAWQLGRRRLSRRPGPAWTRATLSCPGPCLPRP